MATLDKNTQGVDLINAALEVEKLPNYIDSILYGDFALTSTMAFSLIACKNIAIGLAYAICSTCAAMGMTTDELLSILKEDDTSK